MGRILNFATFCKMSDKYYLAALQERHFYTHFTDEGIWGGEDRDVLPVTGTVSGRVSIQAQDFLTLGPSSSTHYAAKPCSWWAKGPEQLQINPRTRSVPMFWELWRGPSFCGTGDENHADSLHTAFPSTPGRALFLSAPDTGPPIGRTAGWPLATADNGNSWPF